ncbi:MAG: Maf family protein [Actinomycetota bacterium]|nr:Maf family protein [Actinomycetota bacterium]
MPKPVTWLPEAGPALVLASRSPQRRAILEQLGVSFTVRPADVAEDATGEPAALALAHALRKARAAVRHPGETVLGVDTVVALEGEVFGKPSDEDAARGVLRRLAGRTHAVHSGVAVVHAGQEHTASAVTAVTFRALDADQVAAYAATGEWRERAGGYAIQGRGAVLVRRIEGDYLNVVGLPVAALVDLLPALLAVRPAR